MKKIIRGILSICVVFGLLLSFSYAKQYESRWSDSPMDTLDSMMSDANKGGYKIQETALDGVTDLQGGYARDYKITNTLDYLRKNIDPYMQWAVYVGLVLATIVLIYMGFLMVTGGIHKSGDFSKLKSRFGYVIIGVLLLSGFYVLVKVAVALLNTIFG